MSVTRDALRLLSPRRGEERAARRLSYGSGERAMLYVLLSLVVVEGVGLYLLLRGTWFGLPIGIADALSIPYLLGMIASTKSYPHLVLPGRLVLRDGSRLRLDLPLSEVSSIRPHFRMIEAPKPQLDGERLVLPHGGSTNMEIDLVAPVQTPLGPACSIAFTVDERDLRRLKAEPLTIG